MKNFTTEKYVSPTEEEVKIISEKLKKRRYEMSEYGLRFGIAMICIGLIYVFTLFQFSLVSNFFSFIFPLIFLEAGICSIIGGIRNKKEAECFEKGEFVLNQGIIKEEKKRNCWSTYLTIQYDNSDETETFSFIGKPAKKDDSVYIVIADKNKIKWAIPRICMGSSKENKKIEK